MSLRRTKRQAGRQGIALPEADAEREQAREPPGGWSYELYKELRRIEDEARGLPAPRRSTDE
jgi:hypothetical protein